jgi:hypothetical protein
MCILFYPKSFGRTREFPSGGKKAYGWDACSSQGDKCQPWCMQIKPRQQVVKGVRTPFDPGGGGGGLERELWRPVCKRPACNPDTERKKPVLS